MPARTIQPRIFVAVEGKSEQSFVQYIRELSKLEGTNLNLDTHIVSCGAYHSALSEAVRLRATYAQGRSPYVRSMLLLDTDRDVPGEWGEDRLRNEAKRKDIHAIFQKPNYEGWLVGLHTGRATANLTKGQVKVELNTLWPDYSKPADKITLFRRFPKERLFQYACADLELKKLLGLIGFKIA
jgi:hypothetical protein